MGCRPGMPCSLFVPTVRGSRQCAVCQCSLEAHCPAAIYVEPSKIFTAPNTPRTERKQPRYVIFSVYSKHNWLICVLRWFLFFFLGYYWRGPIKSWIFSFLGSFIHEKEKCLLNIVFLAYFLHFCSWFFHVSHAIAYCISQLYHCSFGQCQGGMSERSYRPFLIGSIMVQVSRKHLVWRNLTQFLTGAQINWNIWARP